MKRFGAIFTTLIVGLAVVGLTALPALSAQSTTINFHFLNTLSKALNIGSTAKNVLTYKKQWVIEPGTGANKAEAVWHDQRTLNASASEDLDLSGTLADAFGDTVAFTKIKAIAVFAAAGNTNNVVVGGHATAAFTGWVNDATDKVVVKPGGLFVVIDPSANGYAVTATSADLLTVANSAGGSTVTYDIIVLGETT